MPRLKQPFPSYCKHRASGQAVVRLSGEDFYLGPHGTKTSHLAYDRAIAEWLARGRQPINRRDEDIGGQALIHVLAAYIDHAEIYYRKNGEPTNEVKSIKLAIRVVRELYARTPAAEFGPLKLQAVQHEMIRRGLSRKNINKQISRIVRCFTWAVSQQLVPKDTAYALKAVPGLAKGRCDAKETAPVLPVDDATVHATIDHLPPIVANMVMLQRFTGCRPEEICLIRPCDVDTSGSVWAYRPESHKTEHHGRERVVFIGPRGQEILRPYLLRSTGTYCFSPAEGEGKRRVDAHDRRRTPITCGNRPGTNRATTPCRKPGHRYTPTSYRRAIHRACELAFGMPLELRRSPKAETPEQKTNRIQAAKDWRKKHCWSPNRLRHSAATEIRKRFGVEAAQVTLGHAKADISQVYAERDLAKAAEVMALVG